MNVLVIDIGGTHVKLAVAGGSEAAEFASGPTLSPTELVEKTRRETKGWKFDVISLGYPGLVQAAQPGADPGNLGGGWVGFDFEKAFEHPVRVVNDAALQALGGYAGGRMLFLGIGTGLGSALIAERVVISLELGRIHHRTGRTLGERLGVHGLESSGIAEWRRDLEEAVTMLRLAFAADYVLLGGGNASRVDPLPPRARRGGNEDAIRGGELLWQEYVEPHDRKPSTNWRVV